MSDMTLTVSIKFTLTCISTGGPATTVTWTRDSTTVTEGTETVLDDPVIARYTYTLTVNGAIGGHRYTCTVRNNKPSIASLNYTAPSKYAVHTPTFLSSYTVENYTDESV